MPDGNPWTAEVLTDGSREAFYRAAIAQYESGEKDSRAVRRLGLIVGGIGMLIGLAGITSATVTHIRTPVPTPPGWIFADKSTGVIDPPVSAVQAPRYFNEVVRERALRDMIVACEGYVPETWARLDYHACMVMATPAEQKRIDADIGRTGVRYPPTTFGPGGWAMPTTFPVGGFTLRDVTGNEPNVTYHYQVRYERTEVVAGKETRPRYTADVYFQFHPELKASGEDQRLNPYGFQALSFSTTRD